MYGVASLPPGHVTSSDLDLAFNGDGSSIWALTTVYGPTARTFVAGCTEVTLATGMSWSSSSTGNAGSLSVQGTATRTVERSDCNDAGVNQSAMPALDEPFVPRIDNELYRINGNTLTFTDSGTNTATLTRQ